eukprot:10903_1
MSLPTPQLAKLFSMEERFVRRSINKMTALGYLSASWDSSSGTLHLNSQPCNFVQKQAIAFCGKKSDVSNFSAVIEVMRGLRKRRELFRQKARLREERK